MRHFENLTVLTPYEHQQLLRLTKNKTSTKFHDSLHSDERLILGAIVETGGSSKEVAIVLSQRFGLSFQVHYKIQVLLKKARRYKALSRYNKLALAVWAYRAGITGLPQEHTRGHRRIV
jgi:hypothetical protein